MTEPISNYQWAEIISIATVLLLTDSPLQISDGFGLELEWMSSAGCRSNISKQESRDPQDSAH